MRLRGIFLGCAALVVAIASPIGAQGRLGLLPQGDYVCALPGNAAGAAWVEDTSRQFTVTSASSYRTEKGTGTYLLEGRSVTFTRGPLKGIRLMVLNSGLLQEVDEGGRMSRLRCHRAHAGD